MSALLACLVTEARNLGKGPSVAEDSIVTWVEVPAQRGPSLGSAQPLSSSYPETLEHPQGRGLPASSHLTGHISENCDRDSKSYCLLRATQQPCALYGPLLLLEVIHKDMVWSFTGRETEACRYRGVNPGVHSREEAELRVPERSSRP